MTQLSPGPGDRPVPAVPNRIGVPRARAGPRWNGRAGECLARVISVQHPHDLQCGFFRDCQSWLTTQAWYQFATAEPDQIN